MISDAQVHIWTDDRPMAEDAKPHMAEPANAERMIGWMDEGGVDRAVLNPLYLPGMSSAYGLEAARQYPDRFKVMGWLVPEEPGMLESLETWLDDPGMCSIRFSFANPAHVGLVKENKMEPYWEVIERKNIPVGVFAVSGLSAMVPTFEKHPDVTFIIDHINMPMPPETIGEKVKELVSWAHLPNVFVKLSALPRFSTEPYPYPDLLPHVQALFEAFGTERMMWGTDITQQIARNRATYRENVELVTKEYANFLSAKEVDDLMNGTFERVFRWPSA